VETAHPSSFHVSIMWFSCKLGPLIWGIGACALRAQCYQQSPLDVSDRLLKTKPELDCPSSHFFEYSNQPRETRVSDLG
jgi:hypothetical protein